MKSRSRSQTPCLTLPAPKGIEWEWSFGEVLDHDGQIVGSSWHLSSAWSVSQSDVRAPFQAKVTFFLAESLGKSRGFAWRHQLCLWYRLGTYKCPLVFCKPDHLNLPSQRSYVHLPGAQQQLSLPLTKVQRDQLEIVPVQGRCQIRQDQTLCFWTLVLPPGAGCPFGQSQDLLSLAKKGLR